MEATLIPALHCFQTLLSMNFCHLFLSPCAHKLEQTAVGHEQQEVRSLCQSCFLVCCRSGCTKGFQQGGSQGAQALAEEAAARWGYQSDSPGLLWEAAGHLSQLCPASRATSFPQESCLSFSPWKYPLQTHRSWEDVICFPQGWYFCQVFFFKAFLFPLSGSSSLFLGLC